MTNSTNQNANNKPNANSGMNFYNQLNAGEYYGIGQQDGCTNQGCVPNTITQEQLDRYSIPSISDIAAYNRAVIVDSNLPGAQSGAGSQATGMNANGVPDTPATVLNYGATIDSDLQGDLGITDLKNPYPVTADSLQYLNGFIRTQIGRRVTIDFLVGSNTIVSKSGFLLGVASNYILLNELDTNDITTCDFYNIKFIRFYY